MNRTQSPFNSIDKNIQKELKILINQINKPSKKLPPIKISEIYSSLYKEAFPLILLQSRSKFFDKINKEVEDIILKIPLKSPNDYSQILESKEKMIKKYEADYKLLSSEYKNFLRNKKAYKYFSHFRKHCGKTENYGYHYCDNNKKSKFIEIKKGSEVNYVICEGCKICYSTDFILMYCTSCNRKYFSNKLKETEDDNILPATWGRYHCNYLIKEIMKCIKCKSILYLNLKSGYLQCLNKKCKFISKPEDISWTCIICGIEFTSFAKVYNPLDFLVLNNSIKFALIKQIKTAPKKLPCGCTKDLSNLTFYHKEECNGVLLKGTLMDKGIIVCSKCHAINFEEKFTWICPICGIKFHLHSVIGTKPFAKKKYVINKSFNRSLEMNESRYLLRNLRYLNIINDNKNNINDLNSIISPRKGGNITTTNNNSKKIYFKNNLSPIHNKNPFRAKENKIIGYDKKIIIENLNQNSSTSSNSKKKQYRTLLDILQKRQISQPEKSKEKNNEFNKTILPSNNKSLKIFQIPKKDNNLLKNSYKVKKNFNIINTNKNNNKTEIQNSEENKGTYKYLLDTTDNSSLKTSSMNEQNKNIYNNKKNNKNVITSYKAWEKGKKLNINNRKDNKNVFNLYKNTGHRLQILKLKENDSNTNDINNIMNLRNTTNISVAKNPLLNFYNLNIQGNNTKASSPKIKEKENDTILYSDRTSFKFSSPFERKKNNNMKNFKENTGFDPFQNNENDLNKKTINQNSSSDEENEKEKNDTIKDFFINSCNKRNRRESLILHGNFMRQSILISQEKINNLSKKTNIPSFNESDYNIICPIGEGTYGTVFLVENNDTLEQYALKKIICRDYIELIKQKEELELIFSVEHENILKLYGIQFKYLDETTSSIQVLMELANSDWNKEIKKRFLAKKYYKENELINLLKQIIKGFLFLQDKNIAHRDIKPQNILLFPKNVYKICDFGEAKFIKSIKEQSTLRGSELFMSPLLYKGYKYNQKNVLHNPFKSDVFSLGHCLIYAMCLNLNVLDALRELTSKKSIINCINKFLIPNTFSKKLINLVYKMIEPNEDLRYDFEDLSNELKNF